MVAGSGSSGVLWERAEEISLVERIIAVPAAGVKAVVVVGEPGIGKSSLWVHGVVSARRAGFRVLAATCVEAESDMPYAALEDLLVELLDEHEAELPGPQREALHGAFRRGHTEIATDPRTVAAGLVTLLRHALTSGPVVIAVDDVHWLDADTHTCLAYAVRRLADRQLVLLMAARDRSPLWRQPPERSENWLAGIVGSDTTTVRLSALSGEAIGHILRDRLGITVSTRESQRIAAETGGNPFWALEFGQRWPGRGDGGSPPSVGALIADRIAHLDGAAIEASCLVAALGRPRPAMVLGAIEANAVRGEQPGVRAEDVIDRAVTAGLLTLTGGRLTPSHPLIGTVLLASLPPFRRRRLHRQAAELAESAEARALQLLQAVKEIGTEASTGQLIEQAELLAALDEATTAARRRGAPSTAVRFAVRALALLEHGNEPVQGPGNLAERRVTAAELHYQAGDLDEVLAMIERVDLAELGPDLLERAAPLLAQTTNELRGGPAARAAVEAIARLSNQGLSPRALVRRQALVSTLRADLQCGAIGDRRSIARRAVEQVEASSAEVPLRRRALAALAYARSHAGEPSGDVVERLETLGPDDVLDSGGGVNVELILGMSRWSTADLGGAEQSFRATFEKHVVTGNSPAVAHAGDMLAYVQLKAGRLASADKTLARVDEHVGPRAVDLPYVVNSRGLLQLARGEHEALDNTLDKQTTAGHRSGRGLALAAHLHGLLALQRDDPERAAVQLGRCVELAEQHGVCDPLRRMDADVPLADALIAIGDFSGAARVTDVLDVFARRTGRTITRAHHRRALANLLARRDHDLDRAMTSAREAVALLENGPLPADYGRCLITLAEIHQLRGESAIATEHRQRAHALFAKIDHRWWAARSADPTAASGADDLSPRERLVIDLVAGGATNRQAATALNLSVRTVENHLARIYRKLGIRSRDQLSRR